MTEPIVKDNSLSQEGNSTEDLSSSKEDQATVFSDAQLVQLKGLVDKTVQSTTDKRFQRTDNKISGITETLHKVADVQKQYGVTQEQAISIIERDEKIDAVLSGQNGAQAPSDGSGEDMSELGKSILTGAGLDPASDAARAFVNDLVGKPTGEFATELTKWALERGTRPKATDGDKVAPGGDSTSATEIEALHTKLATLQGQPKTPQNMAERKKILAEMKNYD